MTDTKRSFRAELVSIEKTDQMEPHSREPLMRVTFLIPHRDAVNLAPLFDRRALLGEIQLDKPPRPSLPPPSAQFRWEDNLPDPVKDLEWEDWQRTNKKVDEWTCWDTGRDWFCSVDREENDRWRWVAAYAPDALEDFPDGYKGIEQIGLAESINEAADFARAWALAHAREPKRLLDIVNTPDL